jgi:hypothetical protein
VDPKFNCSPSQAAAAATRAGILVDGRHNNSAPPELTSKTVGGSGRCTKPWLLTPASPNRNSSPVKDHEISRSSDEISTLRTDKHERYGTRSRTESPSISHDSLELGSLKAETLSLRQSGSELRRLQHTDKIDCVGIVSRNDNVRVDHNPSQLPRNLG